MDPRYRKAGKMDKVSIIHMLALDTWVTIMGGDKIPECRGYPYDQTDMIDNNITSAIFGWRYLTTQI